MPGRQEDHVINPTAPSPATSPSGSVPAELKITSALLRKAATDLRALADDVGKQAAEARTANAITEKANRLTPMITGTTLACGHVSTSLENMRAFYLEQAGALDDAALAHDREDEFDARRFDVS
jgi:hypothetical protein